MPKRSAPPRASARVYRRRRAAAVLVLLVALLGGYAAADVADLVPGPLTARAPAGSPEPFPTAVLPGEPAVAPVAGPEADAPVPSALDLAALTDVLLADPATAGARVSVVDALDGTALVDAGAARAAAPASTLKVLGAAAALAAAGPDHRFTTRVVDGAEGAVVLVGGGDLALAAGQGDPDAVVGHAGLGDLAAQTAQVLLAQGRTSVALGLDESLYAGPELAPRWDARDLAVGDAMRMSPLAVEVGRLEGTNRREADPGRAAAQAFADALEREGVQVTGDLARGPAPQDADELAAVTSAPLADVAAYTLQVSENILAEAIGRLVALEAGEPVSFAGAGTAVRAVLAERGVDVTGLDLVETSGLSSANRVAPVTLTSTLELVASDPALSALARGLPVAALEGTLDQRLGGTPAAGTVAAKTGTLLAVVSLSGYVTTADGRLLAFAVIAADVPAGALAQARAAVDDWAAGVAACGCS